MAEKTPENESPKADQGGARAGNEPRGNEPSGKAPPPLERSQFGGSARRARRSTDDDPPVSRSDLSKGPQELLEHRASRTNWRVLLVSSLVILAFSIWAIFRPADARVTMKATVDWIALSLGWYYVLTMTLVIGFVVWVALSKEGNVRLGPDHSRPQYKLGTWVAMLFAAGVGIDMLFYSVTGPVVQYLHPPAGGAARPPQCRMQWSGRCFTMASPAGRCMRCSAWRWVILRIAEGCRSRSGRRCIRCWANACAGRWATGSVYCTGGHGVRRGHLHGNRGGVTQCGLLAGFWLASWLGASDRAGGGRRGADDWRDYIGCGPGHSLDFRA